MGKGTGFKNRVGFSLDIHRLLMDVSYEFGSITYGDVTFNRSGEASVYELDHGTNTYSYYGSLDLQSNETFKATAPTTGSRAVSCGLQLR